MDFSKLWAALIRAFYTIAFPIIATGIDWALQSGNLESVGVEDGFIILAISGFLYGLKKYLFPDTKF